MKLTKDESKIIYDELVRNRKIVERLKNELKWFKEFHSIDSDWTSTAVKGLLQKILEGKE